MPYSPIIPSNQSICLPMCPLKSPKNIAKSSAPCILNSFLDHHRKTVFLPNCFHFADITHKSTSAHSPQTPSLLLSLNDLPFLLPPPFHTAPPSPMLPNHQLNLLFQTTTAYISFLSSSAS